MLQIGSNNVFRPEDTAGHHSDLYPTDDYEKDNSAHKSVRLFLEAGVPFYGRSWIMESAEKHGISMPVAERARGEDTPTLKIAW